MAQNDTHVALIILTTQMWGGLLVEKTFSGQNLCSCAFGANIRSYTKQRARHGTPFLHPPPPPLAGVHVTPPPPSAGVHVTPPPPSAGVHVNPPPPSASVHVTPPSQSNLQVALRERQTHRPPTEPTSFELLNRTQFIVSFIFDVKRNDLKLELGSKVAMPSCTSLRSAHDQSVARAVQTTRCWSGVLSIIELPHQFGVYRVRTQGVIPQVCTLCPHQKSLIWNARMFYRADRGPQPVSPRRRLPVSMAFVTDSNRPQPLFRPPPGPLPFQCVPAQPSPPPPPPPRARSATQPKVAMGHNCAGHAPGTSVHVVRCVGP